MSSVIGVCFYCEDAMLSIVTYLYFLVRSLKLFETLWRVFEHHGLKRSDGLIKMVHSLVPGIHLDQLIVVDLCILVLDSERRSN